MVVIQSAMTNDTCVTSGLAGEHEHNLHEKMDSQNNNNDSSAVELNGALPMVLESHNTGIQDADALEDSKSTSDASSTISTGSSNPSDISEPISGDSSNSVSITRKPCDPKGHAILDVECGENNATLHLERLLKGSRSPSVLFTDKWMTPNEFQCVSGRKTAKDWKRSMRHHGRSLKMLIGKGVINLDSTCPEETRCLCDTCTGIPHDALKDIPVQRGQKSPTTPPVVILPTSVLKTSHTSGRKSRSAKRPAPEKSCIEAATPEESCTGAETPEEPVQQRELQGESKHCDSEADCTDGFDKRYGLKTKVQTKEREAGGDTKGNNRSLLKTMLLDMSATNENALMPPKDIVALPVEKNERLQEKPRVPPIIIRSLGGSVSPIICNEAKQRLPQMDGPATPASSSTQNRSRKRKPKRGRLINIINNLRSHQDASEDDGSAVVESTSIIPGDTTDDKAEAPHRPPSVSDESASNPRKRVSSCSSEELESKQRRLLSGPPDAVTMSGYCCRIPSLPPGVMTTTTTTSATTTCSNISSGLNKTELVNSEMSTPRPSVIEPSALDNVTSLELHQLFAPCYQQQLLMMQNKSSTTWSSDPLPKHSHKCADKHCEQMRQKPHSLVELEYHRNVARWAMSISGVKYNKNNGHHADLEIHAEDLSDLRNKSCVADYEHALLAGGAIQSQPALDLSC